MNKKRRPGRSISQEIVEKRCEELGLIYLDKYVNNGKSYVVYRCPKHLDKGEITSAWTHIKTGTYGCPYCSGKHKTTDEFKKEVSAITQDIQILGEYKTMRTKIKSKCSICDHEWFPEARSLLYGQGCPECARMNRPFMKRKTQEQFEKEMLYIHPNIEVCSEYLGTHKKIKCRCKIHNNEWESYPSNLLNKSAGCPMCAIERFNNSPSQGEQKIGKWLSENEINYESEKVFDGCYYRRPLRFDFYLPDYEVAIEYDGEQHYRPVGWYANDIESFYEMQKRDAIKDSYCQKNGIHLLRIPFTEYNRIDDILNHEIKENTKLY